MNSPLVSIVIASYNRAQLVARAVHSALGQSYSNIEVIVSDDCSPDNTLAVLNSITDPRLRVLSQSRNLGVWENWTGVLKQARGEFLVLLGDDDWLSASFVESHLLIITSSDPKDCTFSSFTEVNAHGEHLRQFPPPFGVGKNATRTSVLAAALRCQIYLGSAMIRKSLALSLWQHTKLDDIVADVGLLLRMALTPSVYISAVDGCEYFKTMNHQGATGHEQLSGQYVKVTSALRDVILRVLPLSQSAKESRMLTDEASNQGIVLARHYAALGDLDACRLHLWASARLYPTGMLAWSQLLQSYICPGRLAQTARNQRGLT